MHVRYSARALIAAVLFGTGCNEAIYTLGRLPAGTEKRNSCRDFDMSDGACAVSMPGSGGEPNAGSGASTGSGGFVHGSGGSTGRGAAAASSGAGTAGSLDSGTDSPVCPNDRRVAVQRSLNLYLLVDDSLSVVLQPAWNSLTLAINGFVDDPRNTGLGVGIGYYGISCTAADYATPAVAVAPLPDNAPAVKASYPLPINGKALTAAVTGALSYVRALANVDSSRDAALVLVTDAIADPICGSSQTNAAQAISAGLSGSPSVPTHVIALGAGPSLLDPANIVDLAPLDALAAAGGTKQAARIEVNLATNAELTAALNAIALAASPCAFEIPAGIESDRAALEWESGAPAKVTAWPHIADANSCGGKLGVYVRPDRPGYVELCPSSCNVLRSGVPGRVWIRTECR